MQLLFLTGSNGQLGKVISQIYSTSGWKIFGLDISIESSNSFLSHYISGSVIDRSNFNSLFQASFDCFKSSDIDKVCLINNAGVAVFSPSEDRTEEEFDFVAKTNLLGPIYGMTEFKKFFIDDCKFNFPPDNKPKLSIINVSSIYSLVAPNKNIYTDTSRNSSEIYGATKAGLNQMTKYFAVRYAEYGIQVNAVAPGGVLNRDLQGPEFIQNYSKLVPASRMCQPSEVASLCLSISSSGVEYMTGQVLALDGGMSSW